MSKGKNREKRKIMVLTRPKQGETKIWWKHGREGNEGPGVKIIEWGHKWLQRCAAIQKTNCVTSHREAKRMWVPFPCGNVLCYCFEMKGRGKWGWVREFIVVFIGLRTMLLFIVIVVFVLI
jgi:hypothetical protein